MDSELQIALIAAGLGAVVLIVGYNKYKHVIMDEMGKELPVFPSLISGVKALSKLCQYGMRRQKLSA